MGKLREFSGIFENIRNKLAFAVRKWEENKKWEAKRIFQNIPEYIPEHSRIFERSFSHAIKLVLTKQSINGEQKSQKSFSSLKCVKCASKYVKTSKKNFRSILFQHKFSFWALTHFPTKKGPPLFSPITSSFNEHFLDWLRELSVWIIFCCCCCWILEKNWHFSLSMDLFVNH